MILHFKTLVKVFIFIFLLITFEGSILWGKSQIINPTASGVSPDTNVLSAFSIGLIAQASEMANTEAHSESNSHLADLNGGLRPAAIPVLSPEEAMKAKEEAVNDYNHKKIKSLLGDLFLVALSILCIAVLVFSIPFGKFKHIRFLHILDFAGWAVVSFVIMYCAVLIFQINRPGFEFLTSLQPILTSSSLHLFFGALLLFVIVYVKFILPYLLNCKKYKLFVIELFFSILIGGIVIHHLSTELTSDFKTLSTLAEEWQSLPQKQLKKLCSGWILYQRCYYSYYILYKIFGCKYFVVELSQLFMHCALGINVYFLAKQCLLHEKMARLSMILYFFMPVQYLYLTIPSLDLWGGMLLCFNANLLVYLFKKSFELPLSNHFASLGFAQNSKIESRGTIHKIRRLFLCFAIFFKRIPWLFPLIVSILLGITLFWMEMVRNLQFMFCIPMFLFLSAVVVRRIVAKKMKLFSRSMFFICVLCILVPFLSNKTILIICNAAPFGSNSLPHATALYNSPEEVREVVRAADYNNLLPPEHIKDFALDAATSYWYFYPTNYSRYFGSKMSCFSDLFNPVFVATPQTLKEYPQEFIVYNFLICIAKIIFLPLLLVGILCVLFFKRWNSFAFVPIVLFFFFFFLMPTIGECQVRYTSLYYAPMCICASCALFINSKCLFLFRVKKMRTRFVNSVLWGTSCIILFLFIITSLLSSSSFVEKFQWINFHENQRQISSGDFPIAYKEYTDRNYLLSTVFHPAVAGVIPKKTYVEWTISEQTTEGLEYMLYGYLIAPLKDNADFIVKINGAVVWDNSAFAKSGRVYSNSTINIRDEKIIFLDKLKFIAEKENILRVEIVPKNNNSVDFALSAWGMIPYK